MKSIRTEMVLSGVAVLAVVLLVAVAAAYWAVERSLQAQFDAFLEQELEVLTNLVEFGPDGLAFDAEPLGSEQFDAEEGRAYLEVVVEGDSTLFRSADVELTRRDIELQDEPEYWNERLEGETMRFVGVDVLPHVELDDFADAGLVYDGRALPKVQIRLGRRDDFRGPFLVRFRLAALGIGAIALALAALISSTLSRRALLRLDAVGSEIAGLRVDGSANPLPTEALPSELLPIVERLNSLLDRISESVQRERGLSADIAHELRTPIAALKTNFEVTLQRERDPAAYRESLRTALVVLERSERMIRRLLELHRMEAGNLELVPESFDLVQCVQEQLRIQQAAIESKHLQLNVAMPPQLVVRSEPTLWRLIVSNLLDNMVSYAAADRKVRVRLQTHSPHVEFECRNFGSGVDTAGARRMTDRFARADASRDPSGNHVGLGLTMVRQACAMLDLELRIAVEPGGEFCVRVSGETPQVA